MKTIPFRRLLKNLRKNAEREIERVRSTHPHAKEISPLPIKQCNALGEARHQFVEKELRKLGFDGNFSSLVAALENKTVKGGTLSRLGRIALRKGKLAPLGKLIWCASHNKDIREAKFI